MITFIGNNANEKTVTDGGRLKMRLFIDILKREGYDVGIVELDSWKKRFLSIILNIKKAIKCSDTIVIMAGPKGCRFIIPIVKIFNKKKKTRVVFCPVGVGTFDKLIKSLKPEQVQEFVNCKNFYGIKDEKMRKTLESFDYVCPENDIQINLYRTFYGLNNLCIIENFRDIDIKKKSYFKENEIFKIVYASRVKEYKGILDLMEVINDINDLRGFNVQLDIFGDNQLNDDNKKRFDELINKNINYYGAISTDEINEKIRSYDLFCLPTKYYGEGTSGALVESMIAGTPALVSSYSQAKTIISDNVNGFIFEMGSKEDLRKRLIEIIEKKDELEKIGIAAQASAQKYTYQYNRKIFLKIMTGDEK
ncbi:MAG: glycosyltransferase [Bacilli bacterium]|nr:glycosyltransferase [Bacilli bacterium]